MFISLPYNLPLSNMITSENFQKRSTTNLSIKTNEIKVVQKKSPNHIDCLLGTSAFLSVKCFGHDRGSGSLKYYLKMPSVHDSRLSFDAILIGFFENSQT